MGAAEVAIGIGVGPFSRGSTDDTAVKDSRSARQDIPCGRFRLALLMSWSARPILKTNGSLGTS